MQKPSRLSRGNSEKEAGPKMEKELNNKRGAERIGSRRGEGVEKKWVKIREGGSERGGILFGDNWLCL